MALYEYLKLQQGGWISADTYDTEYDSIVTIDADIDHENSEDPYDQFTFALLRSVEIDTIGKDTLTCKWSKFIEDNMEYFKAFTREYWTNQYEDDEEEFIYQWIREIHYYLAGYVGNSTYKAFIKFIINKEIPKNDLP